ETILEAVGDCATRTKDPEVLTEYARNALARTICKQYVDDSDRIWCVTLDPALEEFVSGHVDRERGGALTLPPATQQQIVKNIVEKLNDLVQAGRAAVVLCSPQIRSVIRRMVESVLPQAAVLAYNEVTSDVAVEAVGMAGLNG
ncbi:MAG: flagellar biosynthesis protein FlhA, partial [Phycisphaerae bacterium]|nr:flagellar biosynthesis protein FlhA [Phycisphaerae bacterium]MDW8263504.1 FHIPEP family type III secretion protein [Phycisphaerales bacterium]